VHLGREGHPVTISKVEDIGRQKIVRAEFAGKPIAIVVPEDGEIPAEPRVTFDPAAINIYADSWRIGREG
jgi:glycerol transport system ATP-binding protein